MTQVKLTNVSKTYGNTAVLHGVDLQIDDGEFVVLVGPSGCGKTTLLRMMCGLEEISGGELLIDGQVVNHLPPAKRGIAMVFQSYALYPHMSVFDNMAFGLKLHGANRDERTRRITAAAKTLHIDHLLKRLPRELSGGQRQRVAIGRAIVRKPEVFLFDEPLSNLDAALRVRMRYEFAKLHEDLKTTMVYVTHDQVEAMTLADRIVVLSAGRIEQVGTPLELYEHPDNLFVAGFIGSPRMNFIGGELVEASAAVAELRLADGSIMHCDVDASGGKRGEKVTLGVRPEHFVIDGTLNRVKAAVTFVESLGSSTQAYCDFPGAAEAITCELDGRSRVREGDSLMLSLPPEWCYLFDAEGQAFRRHGVDAKRHAA
jgi:multiple sugar transport system ATP-binding protein